MRKTNKSLVFLLAAATAALALSACSKGGAGDETTKGQGADSQSLEPIELRFSWWGGDGRHTATEEAIAAFEEKYPNIKVTGEYGAWTGWEEKQALNIVGGNSADVMQINWNWIESYGQQGTSFANLNDYKEVLDLTQFPENSLELCVQNDKLMAVPISMTGRLFYWNQTTFDEIGCPIPTDEESLIAAGAAFKAWGEDYYPLILEEYDRMSLMVYYLESVYGKAWVLDGTLNYTQEEIKKGLDFIKKLEDEHVIPTIAVLKGGMADDFSQNPKWINGQYAGMFVWDSGAPNAIRSAETSTEKPNQTFILGEFVKFGDYNGGFTKISMCFAVTATSKHPKEAAMLIDFLLNDPKAVEICGTERGIPCSAAAVKVLDEKEIGESMVKAANAKVLAYSKFPLDSKFEHSDLKANPDGVYYRVFGKLSTGDMDSAQGAKDLIKGIEECLEG